MMSYLLEEVIFKKEPGECLGFWSSNCKSGVAFNSDLKYYRWSRFGDWLNVEGLVWKS